MKLMLELRLLRSLEESRLRSIALIRQWRARPSYRLKKELDYERWLYRENLRNYRHRVEIRRELDEGAVTIWDMIEAAWESRRGEPFVRDRCQPWGSL